MAIQTFAPYSLFAHSGEFTEFKSISFQTCGGKHDIADVMWLE